MVAVDTSKQERPSIWNLAFPSILANLLYTVVAMVQTKFVGSLGAEAVAAVAAGQRVFFALQAVMMAISAGTTALVARAWGADDHVEASRITVLSLVVGAFFGVLLTIPGILAAEPVASMFGLDETTIELAADNIRWMSVFNVAFAVNFILGAALRAAGDAWSPLWIGVGVNIVNVPLLYLLVFGHYGFPQMGVSGAAIAGGIAFAVGGIVMVILWLKQSFRLKYVANKWFRRDRLRRLVQIGYPAGAEMVVFQVGFFFFLMLIGNFYGTEAFAAYNIGGNILMVCMVIGFGFSIAGSTLAGQHLGANDPEGAVRSGWTSLIYAIISMGAIGALIVFYAKEIAVFFLGNEPITVAHTVNMIYLLAAMTPILAIEFAIGGAIRGAGDTRFPLIATFVGLIGARCGLAAVFTYLEWPVVWVYGAMIGDFVVKGIMLLWRFQSGKWKNMVRLDDEQFEA